MVAVVVAVVAAGSWILGSDPAGKHGAVVPIGAALERVFFGNPVNIVANAKDMPLDPAI